MRCPRCGNDNPGDNRYCGMCGATLLEPQPAATQAQRSTPGATTSAAANTTAARPQPAEPVRAPSTSAPEPPVSVSGPSFLGLNNPPPAPRKSSGLSIDPHSSRNLDYLLEDEEQPRGSGAGKVFLILIALLLAAGLGYLRWKGQPIPWLGSKSNKPAATATNPAQSDSTSSSSGTSSSPSITPEPAPGSPATDGSTAPSNPPAASSTNSPDTNTSATPATDSKANATNPAANPEDTNSAPKKAPEAASTESSDTSDDSATPAAKPPAATKPTRPVDTVAEAHKYLYGQGARQDCDRGMRLLTPAANAGNPKAMVEMGALYSAGLCTPHDLPTAYRWFAIALRKDPGNEAIQTDLQKLWGEMTQPERQLAIKLTQ